MYKRREYIYEGEIMNETEVKELIIESNLFPDREKISEILPGT